MALLASQIKHQKSVLHNADDTGATGGAISNPRQTVSEATPGEVMPKLRAQPSGTVDVDTEKQYQISYIENESTTDALTNAVLYLENSLSDLSGNTALDFQSDNASDDSTRSIDAWGVDSLTALVSETTPLNGTTKVTALQLYDRVERIRLIDNSTGLPTPAAGTITIYESGTATVVGIIPPGYSYATREYSIGVPAAKGDVSALTDRKTAPSGISFSRPGSAATGLAIPTGSLGAQEYCAIYHEIVVQPGMPTDDIDIRLRFNGEG